MYSRERKRAKGTCRCIPEGAERLMAKEEQSQFIPRAFVNLPREHITAGWSSQQTEMRKVRDGFVAS